MSYTIGITGGSGSGKTSFLNKLLEHFTEKEICLVSLDNYYKLREEQPLDEKGVKNFDTPEGIDFSQLQYDLKELMKGNVVSKKEYTFNNPNKVPKVLTFTPAPIIIVEGFFIFYKQEIEECIELKIFMDARPDIMLKRRITRDAVERGYDLDDVLYRYENHVIPTYEKYIKPLKKKADIIIPNHTSFDKPLAILSAFIRELLKKK
ncbi:MAG: uridine kinase [Chitinophagaceae bacterium]|nr:uridine kinase [Chitinophagaceae bacterium]